jgi:hypothetical protein
MAPWGSRAIFATLALSLSLFAAPTQAAGWQEAHAPIDNLRVSVRPDGNATVEREVHLRVVAGTYKNWEIPGLDPGATLQLEVGTDSDIAHPVKAHAELAERTPGESEPSATGDRRSVRIVIDEPAQGLRRGQYTFKVRYDVNLRAANAIDLSGPLAKLTYLQAPTAEGRDGAQIVFDLPQGPTEPRLPEEVAGESQTQQITVRRSGDRDEVSLLRAHVAKREPVLWSLRVDPRAFHLLTKPEVKVAPPPPPPPTLSQRATPALAAALAGLAALLLLSERERQRATERRLITPASALLPLPGLLRSVLGALLSAATVVLVQRGRVEFAGVVAASLAMLSLDIRARQQGAGAERFAPVHPTRLREPGPAATARSPRRLWLAGVVAALAGTGYAALLPSSPSVAGALALVALGLGPVVWTRASALSAGAPEQHLPVLRTAYDTLSGTDVSVSVVAPLGAANVPMRLRVAVPQPLRGLRTFDVRTIDVPHLTGFDLALCLEFAPVPGSDADKRLRTLALRWEGGRGRLYMQAADLTAQVQQLLSHLRERRDPRSFCPADVQADRRRLAA